MKAKLLSAIGALAAAALLAGPAAADKTKIDFWYGNSGDISKRVQEVCQHFNDSQKDFEVACTSQGSYYAAVQNTIAAFRGGKPPTIVQVFDVGTLDLMLSDAFYPAYKLMAENGTIFDPQVCLVFQNYLDHRDVYAKSGYTAETFASFFASSFRGSFFPGFRERLGIGTPQS